MWILISVLVLLILLGVVVFWLQKQKKVKTDYYTLFTIGIVWTAIGVPLKNYALSGLGLVFLIVGIINKDKWQTNRRNWNELSKNERKIKITLIIGLSVLVLLGLVAYFFVAKS